MQLLWIKSFIPEIYLSLCVLGQLIYNSFIIKNSKNIFPILSKEIFLQLTFLLISTLFLLYNNKCEVYSFNFLFLNDLGTINIKAIIILISLSILLAVFQNFELQQLNFFEFFILYLISLLALLLLISATDMLSAYMIIEMQALCFYILACFNRYSAFSTEAGLKYFIASSFISVIFLCGCSILYGTLGTLNFNFLKILFSFNINLNTDLIMLANILILVTFLFKLGIVPFHFWVVDVYEGSPLVTTIIFSILPKLALTYFLIKWLILIDNQFYTTTVLMELFGILSIFIGLSFAIQQRRLKRLMIYSSVSQLGFIIVALANISYNVLTSVIYFILIYLLNSFLFWSYFSSFSSFQKKIRFFFKKNLSMLYITSLANLNSVNKTWAYSLLVIFFSIGGLPPFIGFFSKTFIIFNVIENNNIIIAIIMVLVSLASIFYYIRILKVIFFESKILNFDNTSSQIIFKNFFFIKICWLNAFFLFLLFYLFIDPIYFFLYCHNIVFNLFFF